MNNPNQDLLQQYKSEADEILFENLHFDSRLKERVLRSVNPEQQRFSFRKWLSQGRNRWYSGTVAAAAIAALLLWTPASLLIPSTDQEKVNTPSNLHGVGESMDDPPKTMLGGSGTNGNEKQGTFTVKTWSLQSPEEAKQWFGKGLVVPTYTPDGFTLSEIHASGKQKGAATKVIFNYVSGDRSFLLIEDKNDTPNMLNNFDKIDINGVNGYLKSVKSDGPANSTTEDTELHWFADGVHYTIAGIISEDEAVNMAKSLGN